MAIATVVAGAYTGSWNSVALGYTQKGFRLNWTIKGQRIEESDLYGLSLTDIIYRGGQATIDTLGMVYSSGLTGPLFGWVTAQLGRVYAATTPIARLASAIGSSLVLTVVANTAAVGAINTLTANPTVISPDQGSEMQLNSELRTVPLKFECLLTDSAGTGSVFVTT